MSEIYIYRIEINATIPLDNHFGEYERILMILADNIPVKDITKNKLINILAKKEDENRLETTYKNKSTYTVTLYDKGEQLRNAKKFAIKGAILRIEYKFRFQKSHIKSYLGGNVAELTDERIKKLFFDRFNDDFVRPIAKFKQDSRERVKTIIRDNCIMEIGGKKQIKNDWSDILIMNLTTHEIMKHKTPVLSVCDIESALEEMKAQNELKFTKTAKAYRRLYNRIDIRAPWLAAKYEERLKEIFDKVQTGDVYRERPVPFFPPALCRNAFILPILKYFRCFKS